ncbi:MAG: citrate transporter, partial [Clostridia bacterium]|nr:citrate transporter [Clostridia bacterium]
DYPLLLTFVCFFIFAGNMGRIDAVRTLFSSLLSHSVLLFSALSCQVISNVPSAILLSQFTDNYRELLLGVNIGGAGTLIASLASLITFREFTSHQKEKTGRYLALFSLMNFAFLGILAVFCLLVVV